ncbi:MAG TPA: hypothetical protein VFA26_02340 [Gemmataceae bacterium]|nr:hypothetical protein [Gemmataceae bacterium]
MKNPAGRRLPLSLPRTLICDVLHFARKVPTVPVERRMHLAEVVAARQKANPRPSWVAIFAKAFALVAATRPELRRCYMGFPWPHLYEHPVSVASVAFERRYRDEDAVLFAPVRRLDTRGLLEIDEKLRYYKTTPVEKVTPFRRALRTARLPRPLRRFVMWFGLNAWGRKRSHYLGTFGVSVYAGLGAASLHPLSPLTCTLNYGVIGLDGSVNVRLIYDHRVMDGSTVARALDEMEGVLKNEILAELRYFEALDAA